MLYPKVSIHCVKMKDPHAFDTSSWHYFLDSPYLADNAYSGMFAGLMKEVGTEREVY